MGVANANGADAASTAPRTANLANFIKILQEDNCSELPGRGNTVGAIDQQTEQNALLAGLTDLLHVIDKNEKYGKSDYWVRCATAQQIVLTAQGCANSAFIGCDKTLPTSTWKLTHHTTFWRKGTSTITLGGGYFVFRLLEGRYYTA